MANYDGSLEAVDCHIHCVRYDVAFNRGAGGRLRSSSSHLRRSCDVDTTAMSLGHEKDASIPSRPTMMGH
eukprot:scaffold36936_cov266-Skeletonema_dohrnii-CCMP3373.AAC.1